MSTDDQSSRRWFLRYKVELIFLIFLAATVIGSAFHIRHAEYIGAMNNLGFEGFTAFTRIYCILVLISLGFILWTAIQFIRALHTGRRTLPYAVFLIAPPIILGVGWMGTMSLSRPFLRGLEQWVLREVDIDAIQQWVAAEGRKYSLMDESPEMVLGAELPDFLIHFKDEHIWFPDPTSEGGLRVEFSMGNTARNWGLTVGLPAMPMPREGRTGGEYRHPVKPGVYVFTE